MNHFFEVLKAWGPLGAFLVAIIDGAELPNPGGPDYLLLFLAWKQPQTAYLSAALSVAGALVGSLILFALARKGGRKYLDARASGPRALRFRQWFQRYGLVTVFIPAVVPMIPLPMKVFVLSAGALGVSPLAFLLTMAAGKIPRFFGLAYLGKSLGEHSEQWVHQHKWQIALCVLGLVLFLVLLVQVSDRFHNRKGRLVSEHDSATQ
jgi:membrane protein DedA with SNARE-associated domain